MALPHRIAVPEHLDRDDKRTDFQCPQCDGATTYIPLRVATVGQLERHIAMLDRAISRETIRRNVMVVLLEQTKVTGQVPIDATT